MTGHTVPARVVCDVAVNGGIGRGSPGERLDDCNVAVNGGVWRWSLEVLRDCFGFVLINFLFNHCILAMRCFVSSLSEVSVLRSIVDSVPVLPNNWFLQLSISSQILGTVFPSCIQKQEIDTSTEAFNTVPFLFAYHYSL